MGMQEIKLLLVDDNRKVRERLKVILDSEEDIQVVGEAGDGLTAIKLAKKLAPNLILMDVRMLIMGGIEATEILKRLYPYVPIILLGVYETDDLLARGRRAGASAYLVKDAPVAELVKSVRNAYKNAL